MADHAPRYVYAFGGGLADGDAGLTDLLGVKGASLAEMTRLGLPVPPGFTLTTEAWRAWFAAGERLPDAVAAEARAALAQLEERTGLRLGDPDRPLLVSVRSGAAVAMPGMMDTVLNLGLDAHSVAGLAARLGDARGAWDSYRRFLQMYSDVVLGMNPDLLDQLLERMLTGEGVADDGALSPDALERLTSIFTQKILEAGAAVPTTPEEQLFRCIDAVFRSWNNRRALGYRNHHGIDHQLGTAATVQAMVFGNLGANSATGVATTRNPNSGAPHLYGEWAPNAQGEDVVSGVRSPLPLNRHMAALDDEETLELALPEAYARLVEICEVLEASFLDVQELEFTIEDGEVWMLQTRSAKRSPEADVRVGVDMVAEGLIDRAEAIRRVRPHTIDKLMHPRLDPAVTPKIIARGLGASPGAAAGRIIFNPRAAAAAHGRGERVILVRPETGPDDIGGMLKAQGILTMRGGMTSHAAVVARGLSKPGVVGCRELLIDEAAGTVRAGSLLLERGDVITIDGASGAVMVGEVATIPPDTGPALKTLMSWVDGFRRLQVRTNADNARDCKIALAYGAEGVGLCRTEHTFLSEARIVAVREMMLARDEPGRRRALARLLPMQRGDLAAIFEVMGGRPVTVRLLDPPLHEFLPYEEADVRAVADSAGVPYAEAAARFDAMREVNPMLGHRGCRLGVTYPEIYETQVRALTEAACEVSRRGVEVRPEILIPLVFDPRELALVRELVTSTADAVIAEQGLPIDYRVGTMIELPRACLMADQIAPYADFFSIGTNDLTQTTFGISRDDCGRFLPLYHEMGILPADPFVTIDPAVGELVALATEKGRAVNAELKVGICGEQGGEARTIAQCHRMGLDYVSCSPYRVPVARLAAAQAALEHDA